MSKKSETKSPRDKPAVSHPGMMGDGTEEQNLNEPGEPAARITEEEVEEAFGKKPGKSK
jgi:hypothetical protein